MQFELHFVKYEPTPVVGYSDTPVSTLKQHDVEIRAGDDFGLAPGHFELSFDGGQSWIPAPSLRAVLEEAERRVGGCP
jgi:hypothetical protein